MTAEPMTPKMAHRPSAQRLRSVNPATGDIVAEFPIMTADEVTVVVACAREAGLWWADRKWSERKRCLLRWAAWLANHLDEAADLLNREQGKPRGAALVEVLPTLEHIRWAARNAEKVLRRRRVSAGAVMFNHTAEVEYRPYGVIGVIGPWNYPMFTPGGQMAAYALAAGNAVVLKPSEYTPAIGQFLVKSFALANPEVPVGLFSLVTGLGETGAALCASGVDKVAFTGSTATGKRVLTACAEHLVPTVMECGGKDAMIVAPDADVKKAAKAAVWGGYANAGQTCVGIERINVAEQVKSRFLEELRRALTNVRAGVDDDSSYGPMTMPAQVDIVRRHLDDAMASGATALVGGEESIRAPFVDPIVLVDPSDDCNALREETFGPILVVRTVENVDMAVQLANSYGFGLGASVFAGRGGKAIAERIRAGQVAINAALSFISIPTMPFGGLGHSGFGRVHGADGLQEFAVSKGYAQLRFAIPGTMDLNMTAAEQRRLSTLMRLRHGRVLRR